MNIHPLRQRQTPVNFTPVPDRRLARLAIFEDMAEAEPYWRTLEGGLATPYQRYDFLRLWQHHVGRAAGITPFIVVGLNRADEPLFLWPLGMRWLGRLRIAEFLGGKHANFNMGLWRCDIAPHIDAAEMRSALAKLSGNLDLLILSNQPLTWNGATNPFGLLPHQRAANSGFSGALIPDFEALLRARTNAAARKKMRKKERALADMGTVSFNRPGDHGEVRHVLDVFFKQKSARMRALGVTDVFAAAGVRRFIEAAASAQAAGGEPLIELYALTVDDIVVATMGGIVGGNRFCAMFNSIAQGRYAIESPGEQLIVNLVRRCCERELETFDLGIGDARYKSLFCGDVEPLFDSFLPLTAEGRILAFAYRAAAIVKRTVKRQPALWALVRAARRLRARATPAA